jgi:hypothetical protein
MNNIGGNLPVLVEPLSKSIGYRESLWVFYVGAYFTSKYFYLKKNSRWLKKDVFRLNFVPDHHVPHGAQPEPGETSLGGATQKHPPRTRQYGL